jgi:chemotaxis protein CheX
MTARKASRRTATLELPAVLDVCAAGSLHGALRGVRGRPVVLEAGSVQRLGGQCLQVLLAAAVVWRAEGVALRFGAVSEGFEAGLALLGFSVDGLLNKGAAR